MKISEIPDDIVDLYPKYAEFNTRLQEETKKEAADRISQLQRQNSEDAKELIALLEEEVDHGVLMDLEGFCDWWTTELDDATRAALLHQYNMGFDASREESRRQIDEVFSKHGAPPVE